MGIGTHDASAGAAASPVSDATPAAGVNLVGFLEGGLGLGEVARKLERALATAGVPYVPISYRRAPTRAPRSVAAPLSAAPRYDTNLICLNADYLPAFLDDAGIEFFAGRYSIGVWFWESTVFRPEDSMGLRFVDEVWVASEYVRRALASVADVPVHVVPLPVEAPTPLRKTRAELGLPEGFMFLFVFDFVSAQRKNPLAVVEAFEHAFEPGEGPVLVLKGMNGRERKPQWLDELTAAAAGRRDIHVVDEYYAPDRRDSLLASCDCYVSLHRSEGFGLTIAEAMAHGKPVIATGYSGNLEFMNEDNSYPVPYRLVPVPEDFWAHTPGAEWAEPDVDAAATFMRAVYESRGDARDRAVRARDELLGAFSLDRTASFIAEHLRTIREQRAERSSPDLRPQILGLSQELGRGVGSSLADGRRRPRFLRRLLLKALWPYVARQHRFNAATLDALASLQAKVDDLGRRLAEIEKRDD